MCAYRDRLAKGAARDGELTALTFTNSAAHVNTAVDDAIAFNRNAHGRIRSIAAHVKRKRTANLRILTSDDGRILDNGIAIVVRQRVARLLAALYGHTVKRQVAVVLNHDCRRARPLSRVIARNACITIDEAVAHHNRVALEQLEAV